MANTIKPLVRALLTTTTSTVLYTAPASTTAVVTSIVISNKTGTDATVTLSLNDIDILTSVSVPANSASVIDLKQAITTGQTIKGGSSASDSLNIHITGVEIV